MAPKPPCYGTAPAVYRMLRHSTLYHDLGAEHFRHISPEAQTNRLDKLIARLGFTCTLAPIQRLGFCLLALYLTRWLLKYRPGYPNAGSPVYVEVLQQGGLHDDSSKTYGAR